MISEQSWRAKRSNYTSSQITDAYIVAKRVTHVWVGATLNLLVYVRKCFFINCCRDDFSIRVDY